MDRRTLVIIVSMLALAACSGGSNGSASAPQTQQGIFALQSQAASAGEAKVSLHTLSSAGTIVTVVSEFNYDAQRLHMKNCQLNPAIGDGQTGKALHVAEPSPGVLRAVVAGNLDAIPQPGDVFTCTFSVSGSAGPVTVQAHGEVSDTTFEDRTFTTQTSINVGN